MNMNSHQSKQISKEARLEQALSRAIDFLYENQLRYGEFKTLLASDAALTRNCEFDSSPFATSLVVYSLVYVQDPRVKEMIEKGLNFLESEMEWPGFWRYYSSRQPKRWRVPPDLEDTACISYVLKMYGRIFPQNKGIFLKNKNSHGIFLTWLTPRYKLLFRPRMSLMLLWAEFISRIQTSTPDMPEHLRNLPRFRSKKDPVPPEAIDPSINASVVLYLGENAQTRAAINYIIDLIESGQEEGASSFYPDSITLYYMIARAYLHSAPSFGCLKELVVRRIAQRQEKSGSMGTILFTALAACVLLSFKAHTPALHKAIQYLTDTQKSEGSWSRYALYSGPIEFWGSEELTTAFCVEALARYRNITQH